MFAEIERLGGSQKNPFESYSAKSSVIPARNFEFSSNSIKF